MTIRRRGRRRRPSPRSPSPRSPNPRSPNPISANVVIQASDVLLVPIHFQFVAKIMAV